MLSSIHTLRNLHLFQAIFDAFSSEIALIDQTGKIIAVNEAWKHNLIDSGIFKNVDLGDRYLDICKSIFGGDQKLAELMIAEIRMILNSEKLEFRFNYTDKNTNPTNWFVIQLKQFKQADWLGILIIKEDITKDMQTELALRSVVEGTAAVTGQDFFCSLVYHLTRALSVDYAFVTECLEQANPTRVRTLAFWYQDNFRQNFEYSLQHTPCQKVIGGSSCHYPKSVIQAFPQDFDLLKLNAESYIGVPLVNSSGEILGHLAIIDQSPIEDSSTEMAILKIFASRAAAELERQKVEDQLAHDALHDRLTNLPNRYFLINHLHRALEKYRRNRNHKFAVFFLDLDRFKYVNDSLGHQYGDQLLVKIAQRLKSCLRSTDILARLGGDEFAILIEDIHIVDEAHKIAERIQQSLESPFFLDIHEIFSSVSIGIAFSEPNIDSPEELLRNADMAMYKAKTLGKTRYDFFDESLHIEVVNRLHLETDLRNSLDRGEFCLDYQPIISLVDNRVMGFEALVRWQHPQRGYISPAEFIPLAEETGLIIPLSWWILQESCYQLREWQIRFNNPNLTMAVNISPKQFCQPYLIDSLLQILQITGLEAYHLNLEITETLLMENMPATRETLKQLKSLGCKLYLDDFGTGYSSLSYLHSLPIDFLKIDRSFVAAIDSQGKNSEIVEAIVMMAKSLGLQVIAEGIETRVQLAKLQALKCPYGQGYLFAKPSAPQLVQSCLNYGVTL